jgi:hypothetical protein
MNIQKQREYEGFAKAFEELNLNDTQKISYLTSYVKELLWRVGTLEYRMDNLGK